MGPSVDRGVNDTMIIDSHPPSVHDFQTRVATCLTTLQVDQIIKGVPD